MIGVKMKGTNNTGFNTIGNPKIIGSLIPKQAGNKVNFPIVLYLLLLAKNAIAIAQPIVVPVPPSPIPK